VKTQGFLTCPLAVCPEDLRRLAYPEAALWQHGHGRLRGWGLNRTFEAQRGFLSALQELWRDTATAKDAGAAQPGEALSGAFHGGWVVYLGYELAAEIEACSTAMACSRPSIASRVGRAGCHCICSACAATRLSPGR